MIGVGLVAVLLTLGGFLLIWTAKANEVAQRTHSINNLKQIGLAMQSFHDTNKRLPFNGIAAGRKLKVEGAKITYYGNATTDTTSSGSWLFQVLPFVDAQPLSHLMGEPDDEIPPNPTPPFNPSCPADAPSHHRLARGATIGRHHPELELCRCRFDVPMSNARCRHHGRAEYHLAGHGYEPRCTRGHDPARHQQRHSTGAPRHLPVLEFHCPRNSASTKAPAMRLWTTVQCQWYHQRDDATRAGVRSGSVDGVRDGTVRLIACTPQIAG